MEFDQLDLNNYIYIYHLPSDQEGTGTYIYLPQWPDQITDKLTSTFSSQNALSRSAPVFSYSNSGPRTVDFSFQLHRDMMNEANMGVSNVFKDLGDDYVDAIIKQLQAIALPNYHAVNKEVQPPMVAVRLGDELFIKGVVSNGISVEYVKPLLTNNKYAVVNISFVVSEIDPQDAIGIAETGSFRKITRTFQNTIDKAAYNAGLRG